MRELALFAGAGGGILGGPLLGWRTVCAVEIDEYCRKILMQRQDEGHLHPFPIWDDVQTFDGKPWRGSVDVISGGFPCQDISAAGRGAGIEGSRSGLWSHMARIIGEVRPRYVFVENSPLLVRRGLAVVLGDLAEMGFDARWCVLGADDCGAPHRRKRIWILAHTDSERLEEWQGVCGDAGEERETAVGDGVLANASCGRCCEQEERQGQQPWRAEVVGAGEVSDASLGRLQGSGKQDGLHGQAGSERTGKSSRVRSGTWWSADPADVADAASVHVQGQQARQGEIEPWRGGLDDSMRVGHDSSNEEVRTGRNADIDASRWGLESGLGRVANGVANRVDRLRAVGNGQVPIVAATAWRMLGGQ